MPADRIPCLNPRCRRTFARRPGDTDTSETVCAKCWKLLPKPLTQRYRQIDRRWKAIARRVQKREARGQAFPPDLFDLLHRHHRRNWTAIRSYFTNPPAPEGLENFLKKVGLG